jgi:hypothetical protein
MDIPPFLVFYKFYMFCNKVLVIRVAYVNRYGDTGSISINGNSIGTIYGGTGGGDGNWFVEDTPTPISPFSGGIDPHLHPPFVGNQTNGYHDQRFRSNVYNIGYNTMTLGAISVGGPPRFVDIMLYELNSLGNLVNQIILAQEFASGVDGKPTIIPFTITCDTASSTTSNPNTTFNPFTTATTPCVPCWPPQPSPASPVTLTLPTTQNPPEPILTLTTIPPNYFILSPEMIQTSTTTTSNITDTSTTTFNINTTTPNNYLNVDHCNIDQWAGKLNF